MSVFSINDSPMTDVEAIKQVVAPAPSSAIVDTALVASDVAESVFISTPPDYVPPPALSVSALLALSSPAMLQTSDKQRPEDKISLSSSLPVLQSSPERLTGRVSAFSPVSPSKRSPDRNAYQGTEPPSKILRSKIQDSSPRAALANALGKLVIIGSVHPQIVPVNLLDRFNQAVDIPPAQQSTAPAPSPTPSFTPIKTKQSLIKEQVEKFCPICDVIGYNIPQFLSKTNRFHPAPKLFTELYAIYSDCKPEVSKRSKKKVSESVKAEAERKREVLKNFAQAYVSQLSFWPSSGVDIPKLIALLDRLDNESMVENIRSLLEKDEKGILFYILFSFFEKDGFAEILTNVLPEQSNIEMLFLTLKFSPNFPWLFCETSSDILKHFLEIEDYETFFRLLNLFLFSKSKNEISDCDLESFLSKIYSKIVPYERLLLYPVKNEELKKQFEDCLSQVKSDFKQFPIIDFWLKKIQQLQLSVEDDHIFGVYPLGNNVQGFHVMDPAASEISFHTSRATGTARELFPRVVSPSGVASRTFDVAGTKNYPVQEDDSKAFAGIKTSTTPPFGSQEVEYAAIEKSIGSTIVDPEKWRTGGQVRYLGFHNHEGKKIPKLTFVMADKKLVTTSFPILFFEERDAFNEALAKRVLPALEIITKQGGPSRRLNVNISPQKKLTETLHQIVLDNTQQVTFIGSLTKEKLKQNLIELINKSSKFEILPSIDERVILKTSFAKCGKSLADVIIEALSEIPEEESAGCMSSEEIREQFRDFAEGEIIFVYPSWDHIFHLAGLI